ncbi:Beta-glucosidase 1 [Neolecta irregularis DAH-3]|uniref:beta-glucosidase n=1 Tax=Neolecta irregularis (strain DAH-3) TaxID=1198029 RepID=A0A1U7LRJ0_NEOID|nr:Beta-glucosidase 1 [Neolecta irregularis DAH-3]|eukprot:OLL25290.1 Beta-glucosidase 1 [Neolecta irregularis DAH-3]
MGDQRPKQNIRHPWSWSSFPHIGRTAAWFLFAAVMAAIFALLLGLLLHHHTAAQQSRAVTDPWYPSPLASGLDDWGDAYSRARNFVAGLTLLEKVNITTGTGWQSDRCVGNTGSLPRLGLGSLCLQDSPLGVRFTDYVSVFPSGVQTASTWDKEYALSNMLNDLTYSLIYNRGLALGQEFRGKGVNVALGPVAGPLGRTPAAGRNWEGFSPDPYLTGVAMYQTILGTQSTGVIACAKHLIANEQEHYRQAAESNGIKTHRHTTESLSSNVDDRTLHELYLWPFADAVRAGVGSFMTSYNQINNSYASQNSKIINGLLKDELGFQGFVMTDWAAQHSGVESSLSGLDMTMPGTGIPSDGTSYWGSNLTLAVLNGSLPEWRLDDQVTRIFAALYKIQNKSNSTFPEVNFSSWTSDDEGDAIFAPGEQYQRINDHVDVRRSHSSLIREINANSIVLLKNINSTLPLKSPKQIAIIGSNAGPNLAGPNGCPDRGCDNGTLALGWGSGTADFSYFITPLEAIQSRAISEGSGVQYVLEDYNYAQINATARRATTCLAFINSNSGEHYISVDLNEGDRNNITAWHDGDQLVSFTAANCNNTIVVVNSVGPIILEPWINHPNVTALVWAGLPGEDSGSSLVQVLFGDVNPSGKLPYTIAKSASDYGTNVMYEATEDVPQQDFTEGLFIDYRHFDQYKIEPRFEFGFGLSYSTFSFSSLLIEKASDSPYKANPYVPLTPINATPTRGKVSDYTFPSTFSRVKNYIYPYIPADSNIDGGSYPYPPHAVDTTPHPPSPAGGGPGGNPSLYDVLYRVSATITNNGPHPGKEVAQLYINLPSSANAPPKQLRGFEKVSLDVNASATVTFNLTRRDLSIWDVKVQNWVIPTGPITVFVGRSSRDLELVNIL